jgi:hypothetical protein
MNIKTSAVQGRDINNGSLGFKDTEVEEVDSPEVEAADEVEEEAPKSLRETIEATYNKAVEEENAPLEKPKARDASGKFLKKDTAVSTQGEQVAAAESTFLTTPPTEITAVPRSISPEHADKFKALPNEIKDWLLKVDEGQYRTFSKKMGEIGVKERRYRDLDDAVAPYEVEWAKHGVSVGQVINNYLAWEKSYHENPEKTLGEMAAEKGLTLETILGNKDNVPSPELVELRKKVAQLESGYQDTQKQSIAEYNQSLNNDIESYATEAGQDGKPLRPHFDAVYKYMIPVAKAYREANPDAPERQILDAAYKDAIYLNPQVRQLVLEEEVSKKAADRAAAESEKVQRAKVAGSSLRGTATGHTMVNTKPGSLRETIESAWDELS